jgi:hypothetical protein
MAGRVREREPLALKCIGRCYRPLASGGLRQISAIALPARLFATISAEATAATTRHRERAASARSSIFSIPLSGILRICINRPAA